SAPSALILMMEHGNLLDETDIALRCILFAGEPFPMKHLRRLRQHFRRQRLLNLYGPTETNVCTFYEVPPTLSDEATSIPIGKACSGDMVWAMDGDRLAGPGEEGELFVRGPTVMLGYWGAPPIPSGAAYATGDFVTLRADGNYDYRGRRDHMVKIRGHRVE